MSFNADRSRALLSARRLTKSFSGVQVLHDVSFEAYGGRVLGVVGENGSGKSTTMNLVTGVLRPDGGALTLDGAPFAPSSRRESDAAGIAFVQQELSIFPNLSVAENLFLAQAPRRFAWLPLIDRRRRWERATALLEKVDLQVSPEAPAGALSMGERQLLEIARGLSIDSRVLILDEPTSSLTAVEAARLFGIVRRLQAQGVAIILISHDLDQVLEVADEVLVMRDGRVTLTGTAANLRAKDLVLAMVGRSIESQFAARAALPMGSELVLDVTGLSTPDRLYDIHLQVAAGEIVGIAGLMGSGRSELARAIFGVDRYAEGDVRVDGRLLPSGDVRARLRAGVAFLTEDRRHEGLLLDATVADNIALAALPKFASRRAGILRRTALLGAVRTMARSVGLKGGDVVDTPIRALSGGNQQKAVLARWLLSKPRLLILDEPTRGVDVGAKQDIYRLLAELAAMGKAMLVISSELEELLGLCDRILVMRRGALRATFTRGAFDREAILQAAFGQGEGA